jgi:hypothetical protein
VLSRVRASQALTSRHSFERMERRLYRCEGRIALLEFGFETFKECTCSWSLLKFVWNGLDAFTITTFIQVTARKVLL